MGFEPYDPNNRDFSKPKDPIPYAIGIGNTQRLQNTIYESFRWLQGLDSFKTQDAGSKTIKIKGVAAKAGDVSRNGRKYLGEELKKSVSSMVNGKVTINHKDNEVVGKILWADYEDDQLEYLAEIWKEPYVSLLRNKSADIKGVSIQCGYLFLQCAKCHKKFDNQEAWANHMEKDEFIKEGLDTPHGIVFDECALSLVLTPEIPGLNTTIGIYETVKGLSALYETVLSEKGVSEVNKLTEYIEQRNGEFCVMNHVTGEAIQCFPTEKEAQDKLKMMTEKQVAKPAKTEQDIINEYLAVAEKAPEPYKSTFKFLLGEADKTVLKWQGIAENSPTFQEQQRLIKETNEIETKKLKETADKVTGLETAKATLETQLKETQEVLTTKNSLLKETAEKVTGLENEKTALNGKLSTQETLLTDKLRTLAETETKLKTQEINTVDLTAKFNSGLEAIKALEIEKEKQSLQITELSKDKPVIADLTRQIRETEKQKETLILEKAEQYGKIVEYENKLDKVQGTFKGRNKTLKPKSEVSTFSPYDYKTGAS